MTAAGATATLTGPPSFPNAGADRGECPVWITCTIASTMVDHDDDNILLAGPLPAVAYIANTTGAFFARWTDLDTSTGLDFDLGFGGSDGVLDFTLINNGTTASQSAGVGVGAQLAAQDPWLDIGGLYVVMEVIAAATTAAAGTVQVGFKYNQNVNAALAFAV